MTKRQLRRLAYRVPRDPSLHPILHDALLEVYPEHYGEMIDLAEAVARHDRRPRAIVFDVRAMGRSVPRPSRSLFTLYFASGLEAEQLASAEVPVYLTRSQRAGKQP